MPDTPRPITQHHRAAVALLIMFDLLQEVADEARTGRVAPATAAQSITELGFAAWMDAIGAPPSDFHLHAHRLANEAVEVMPGQRVDDHIVRLAAGAAQSITELGFAAWMDAIGAPPSDFHLHAHRLANEAVEVMPGQRVDDHIVRLALDDPAAFLDAIRTARGAR